MMDADTAAVVLVELRPDQGITPLSLECLTAAKRLAARCGGRTAALIMGHGVATSARELACYGAEDVVLVDHPLLGEYHAELHLAAFLQVWAQLKPRALVMGDSLRFVDLAPRIAFALAAGLVTDCVAIEVDGSEVCFVKPVYSSNVMAAYAFAAEPWIVTLRARAQAAAVREDTQRSRIVPIAVALDASRRETDVIRRVVDPADGVDLAQAQVVVAGGRGVGGPAGFEQLVQVAKLLNAAVGASRPPCDLGWAPAHWQIGQTGAKVAPSVYIAAGISGAAQHVAGMHHAKTIVAINTDRDAPIFGIADYGVVGRCEDVLPAFREALAETAG